MQQGNCRVYIVEDEAIARASLEGIIEDLGCVLLGSAADAEIALAEIIETKPDLLLLDINLSAEKDGIWIARQLQTAQIRTSIVFLTAYGDKETLDRVKEVAPKAYLKKPFDEVTLCTTIELLAAERSNGASVELKPLLDSEFVVVNDGKKKIRLEISKLKYVQSDGNYVRIGLIDATYFIRGSLKWFIERLSACQFYQVHRSTIVNKQYITMLDSGVVYL